MTPKNRLKNQTPLKDYHYMKNLSSRLCGIFPEYDFIPHPNGYEIEIKSNDLRYKRVKMQRTRNRRTQETCYKLSIPEKGRSFECGRLPEMENLELLKRALSLEIKAIDGNL